MLSQILESSSKQQIIESLKLVLKESKDKPFELWQEIVKADTSLLIQKLKCDFQVSLDILLNAMCIQNCFQYLNTQSVDQQIKIIKVLFKQLCEIDVAEKYKKFVLAFRHHSTQEYALVILRLYAQHCPASTQSTAYPSMIPQFVRIAAWIMEKYQTVKNQPAHGEDDRVKNDKKFIQNCQTWVSESITIFFQSLNSPKGDKPIKTTMLALGDLIGALMECEREKILRPQTINNLLQNVLLSYCFKNFSFDSFYNLFLNPLKTCNFQNPISKIEIPQSYQIDKSCIQMNTQAIAFLTQSYLNAAILFSLEYRVKLLLPIVGEMFSRPYEIKVALTNALINAMECLSPLNVRTAFQWEYPLSKFLFELFYHNNENFDKIRKMLKFENASVLINSLYRLKNMNMGNLNPQKDYFILYALNAESNEFLNASERIIVLLRQLSFKESNSKTQDIMISVMERIFQKYGRRVHTIVQTWSQSLNLTSQSNRKKIKKLLQ